MSDPKTMAVGQSMLVSSDFYFEDWEGRPIRPIFQLDAATGERSYRAYPDGGNEKAFDLKIYSHEDLVEQALLGVSIRCLLPDGKSSNRSSTSRDIVRYVINGEVPRRFWWVNHKQTYKDEHVGGYIWSPKTKKRNIYNLGYDSLTRVRAGDVVISFARQEIKAIGIASGEHREEPIPDSHCQAAEYWDDLGWMVPIEWFTLDHPLVLKPHMSDLIEFLPRKYSPVQENGDANQGSYLASVSPMLARKILSLLSVTNPEVEATQRLSNSLLGTPSPIAGRLPTDQLRKVTSEHIWQAVQVLLEGGSAENFGPSTDYDLLVDEGGRLAPKQVFGLAATAALGFTVRPEHFIGGVGTVCFDLLEGAGYRVVPKGVDIKLEDLPPDSEERVWAEGYRGLVHHLRRERATGLSNAKKAEFRRKHGKLFCENCHVDPAEIYGELGEACIEVHHHAIHVAEMGDNHKTTLEDLRCLCANCHRIEHRRLRTKS